ncbi:alpha/beta-hydrolase [Clathrospora elynae]|uniref:cutinase n=1 Tax=Clathrospora elynae TaxID=706981 RepID=A0A6A5SUH8_9PLEO|nr:alpha/beta-hydrolase [Clathrospora elynae]
MTELAQITLTQCPNTKFIVSGYSQGAMVVHNAFRTGLSPPEASGAILFADPLRRPPITGLPAAKIQQFCGTTENICGGGGDGGATGGHISYIASADSAIKAAGLP